jgi:hypothetical protein
MEGGEPMADRDEKDQTDVPKILGDINPEPTGTTGVVNEHGRGGAGDREVEDDRGATGGSNEDRTEHSGSRDVTEGTTGGTGPEVGGTRNYRTGSGVTGTDIGNRPE